MQKKKHIRISDRFRRRTISQRLFFKLFCLACREIMSTKTSVVITHLASKKHGNGKEKLKKSKLNDQTIIEAFKARDRTQKAEGTPR